MRVKNVLYLGLSPAWSVAGDRRRFIYYAKHRKINFAKPDDKMLDCIVVTENTDLRKVRSIYPDTPIVYDLVDAYLVADNYLNDQVRSLAKISTGRIGPTFLPYTKVVARNSRIANAVICSSLEQEKLVRAFNANVHVILDSHDEFQLMDFRNKKSSSSSIFWEGSPYTLPAFGPYTEAFHKLKLERDATINFVTDEYYSKYLGRFIRTKTTRTNRKMLRRLACEYKLLPWSLKNVSKAAENSSVGIIPVNVKSSFQKLKPENRLLIMWRLGLPGLVSATPSHLRVSSTAKLQNTFTDSESLHTLLSHLLDSEEKREENVRAGQLYLSEYHNLDLFLTSWDTALESVI